MVRSQPAGALYRDPYIVITYAAVRVGGRRYTVADLDRLRVVRAHRSRRPWLILAGGAVLAAIGVGLVLAWQPGVPGPAAYLALLAAAVVPAGAALVTGRTPDRRELWGRYRGDTVRLFTLSDTRRFGQITRALLRAYEAKGR